LLINLFPHLKYSGFATAWRCTWRWVWRGWRTGRLMLFSPPLFFLVFLCLRLHPPVFPSCSGFWRRGRSWVRWLFLRLLLPSFCPVCVFVLLCSLCVLRFRLLLFASVCPIEGSGPPFPPWPSLAFIKLEDGLCFFEQKQGNRSLPFLSLH